MAGFNWIDAIIILILAHAVYRGVRIGFVTLLFTFGGGIIAMFLCAWIFPRLLPIKNQTTLAEVTVNLMLLIAALTAIKCFEYGQKLHISLGKGKAHIAESVAGVSLSLGSALIIIWLLAAAAGSLPFISLSNSANNSLIVQALDRHLPAVPSAFEGFASVIDPNSVPKIFVKQLPNSSLGAAALPKATQAAIDAGSSVVRVTSFGCGGIVEGTGFVIGPELVATNAHVIAGVKHPVVKYRLQSIEGQPVLFDPSQDFAVLRVKGLKAQPLKLSRYDMPDGTDVYVIGYPKSIYTLTPGLIAKNLHALGQNIYGLGSFDKDIYEVKAQVDNGSSGSPVVGKDGQVVGIIVGKTMDGNYGVALTIAGLSDDIHQAAALSGRVGTGACLAN